MRHRIHHRKLNRTSEHRRAMLRSMAQSLIQHGRVTTTLPKARTLRPYVERLVTLAVRTRKASRAHEAAVALRARRRIHKLLTDRSFVPEDHADAYRLMSDAQRARTMRSLSGRRYRTGDPKGRLAFTAESVSHRLIEKIAPRFEDRPGGYTRLIRLSKRRLGDASPLAVLEFVGDEESPGSVARPQRSARKRRADARYAMAVKVAKHWSAKRREDGKPSSDEPVAEDRQPGGNEESAPTDADAQAKPDAEDTEST